MTTMPPYEQLGPKMRQLRKDEHRVFVWAYVENGGNGQQAAKDAGYGSEAPEAKRDGGVHSTAWRLLQRADIKEAIREVTWDRFQEQAVMSQAALKIMIGDPNHKDHFRACQAALSLAGFVPKTEHKVSVEHQHVLNEEDIDKAILALAVKYKLDAKDLLGSSAPKKLPNSSKRREAEEATVISEGDWLDDLLVSQYVSAPKA